VNVPGVELARFGPGVERIRVVIEDGEPPPASSDAVRVWDELRAAIPRLFNGGLLSVVSIDAQRGVIRARRDTYQRLVVQPRVKTGVRQLSVTGAVERRGEILLGRRGPGTRMYAGMWELAPAGGVEPPPPGVRELTHEALVNELRREAREEAGLEITGAGMPLAIVYDAAAESYDIVLRVETAGDATSGDWEYQELRWVPMAGLRAFEHEHAPEIIPPTRAIMWEFWG